MMHSYFIPVVYIHNLYAEILYISTTFGIYGNMHSFQPS